MTPAVEALRAAGVAFEVLEYEHDPAAEGFGLEAAEALGLPPGEVFKTLVVRLDRGGLAVGVVPVDRMLDLKAVAAALGAKRSEMADPGEAQRATGYVVGGISPLGQRRRLPTVIDASAEARARICVSGGRRGLDLAIAPADLQQMTGARFAPIARPA